jgi:hypothetical protein
VEPIARCEQSRKDSGSELDVTNALMSASREAGDVSLKLVAVDAKGEEVAAANVRIDEIELVVD